MADINKSRDQYVDAYAAVVEVPTIALQPMPTQSPVVGLARAYFLVDATGAPVTSANPLAMVSTPYAPTGSWWQYAAASGGIVNTTTAVTIKAAHATLRNYVTGVQLTADGLGAATELVIRDGAGGTVLWRVKISTAGISSPVSITFPVALRGSAATLLEVATLTASVTGGVWVDAQGFVAA